MDTDDNQNFEKHKIFVYQKTFTKFSEDPDEVVAYIKDALRDETPVTEAPAPKKSEFDVNFDQI